MHTLPLPLPSPITPDGQWLVPERFNFATDVVDHWAESPDSEAVIAVTADGVVTRHTYGEVSARSKQIASMLASLGLQRGDRVLIMLPRCVEWVLAMVACARAGLVPIPCITMLTASDIEYRARHSGSRGVITAAAEIQKFEGISGMDVRIAVRGAPVGWHPFESADEYPVDFAASDVGAHDPALLYYTSGSTGGPKGVLHASAALFAWRVSAEHWLGLGQRDRIWCTADTGWSKAGTSILYGPMSRGAATVLYDGPFVPSVRFEILRELDIDVFCAAATELRRLVLEPGPIDLPRLRRTVSAGESVNPEIVVRWRDLTGIDVLDGYGQTETLMTVTNSMQQAVKPGSMGRALPGTTIAVLTDDSSIGGNGHSGQLLIEAPSPQLMLRYLDDPERTAASYLQRGARTWFQTGDNVEIDLDGDVFYLGRNDDIINSSGYRIGPQEVENAIMTFPGVQECAVVGQRDPERGEIVVAFVVLATGLQSSEATPGEIQQHVKSVTAPYKYPRRVEVVTELPKTVSGKIRRNELRQRLHNATGGKCS